MNREKNRILLMSILLVFVVSVNAQNKENLKVFNERWKRYGFLNSKNDTIIKPIYLWASDFQDGLALVQNGEYEDVERYGKYGYINEKNEYIIEPLSIVPFSFKDGLAVVQNENFKFGYVNFNKELVIPYLYDEAYGFGFGTCLSIPNGFNNIAIVNIGNSIVMRHNCQNSIGKWGLINKKGEEVLPIKYGWIYGVSCDVAFILDGEFVSRKIDDHSSYIEIKGKFGIIDIDGKIVVEPIYDEIVGYHSFYEGTARVKMDGKEFKINTKGEIIEKY